LSIRNGNGLTTDAASYELREENGGLAFDLKITLRNATRHPIHIVNCHGIPTPTLEKLVDDAWVTYWTGVTPLCLSPPIGAGRGESYTRELRLWGALPGRNQAPAWAGPDVPVTYHLVLHGLAFNYDATRWLRRARAGGGPHVSVRAHRVVEKLAERDEGRPGWTERPSIVVRRAPCPFRRDPSGGTRRARRGTHSRTGLTPCAR
jgi:hypothetical protein